ncbi:MAG: GMC oxidoreductase [Candidatus Loosdrechtia sp.]|uniref:GMC oxidoreductase n=1 Tax=Candidatus Loosdrechtia sp. TaxID=3101272 RepID=UPI003A6925A1|nr:MAG: GMC family oxidoreductase [Candidatus Jettenia sp. AMX2]
MRKNDTPKIEYILRFLFLGLAGFDFILGTIFIFFGQHLFSVLHMETYAQPQFFMICTGLFLYQYVYIQYMAFKNPYKYSTCLNMTVLIRLSFPFVYASAVFLWNTPVTLLHIVFIASAVGDVFISAFILYSMRRLKIPFFFGDKAPVDTSSNTIRIFAIRNAGPPLLRSILLALAIAEFLICWNWILIPKFWLGFFDITYTVDPFWTRATGMFLLNIAYIQFLGFKNVYKYRTAVITSGLFRALWPALYWYWTATGEGNLLFKIFIMFFSFFDLAACITIFSLFRKAEREAYDYAPPKIIQRLSNLYNRIGALLDKYFRNLMLLLAIWDFCLGTFFIIVGYPLLKKYGFAGEFIAIPAFFIQWAGFFIIVQSVAHFLFYLDVWNVKMFWLNFLFRATIGVFHLIQYVFFMHSLDTAVTYTLFFFISGDLSTGGILFFWYMRNKKQYTERLAITQIPIDPERTLLILNETKAHVPGDLFPELTFTESMSGYIGENTENPKKGEKRGKRNNNKIDFQARISIDKVNDFIETTEHKATLEGTFNCRPFGTELKIENGIFNLFIIDKNTDTKKMQYRFNFTSPVTGKRYFFHGVKEIERKFWDIFNPLDPIMDMTTLFVTIYEGNTEKGKIAASGIMRFNLAKLPSLLSSIEVRASNKAAKKKVILNFFGFILGKLGETYLPFLFSRFMKMEEEYDAIVIGSGFGGSATAYKLAKAGKSVCVLERGKKWRGRVKVKSIFDLVPMFRTPLKNGLFDYRIFKNIHVFQANGVGGGSLIYANVLMRPEEDSFDKDWPVEINLRELDRYFTNVEKKLNVRKIDSPPMTQLFSKTLALKKAAGSTDEGRWQLVNLAIQPFDDTNKFGKNDKIEAGSSPCRACSNCVLVCNRSAKNTLDLNYLKEAIDYGAELFPEHEVVKIEPAEGGGEGYIVHYRNLANNTEGRVRGKKVIVAAGVLGSTELLLRCKQNGSLPKLSEMLGSNFSGNGDLQAFAINTKVVTDSMRGPTITSSIDFQSTQPPNVKFVVEEGGFPEALVPFANSLLPQLDKINRMPEMKECIKNFLESDKKDIYSFLTEIFHKLGLNGGNRITDTIRSFSKESVRNCLMYLIIGRDASDGEIRLKDNKLDIHWEHKNSLPLFNNMKRVLTHITEEGLGGNYEPNPLWSLLNILVTVHPLGGCKMGTDVQNGVVNHGGEVFNYPNLYVLDGSIFPKALGVNPSLTIAALAERNAEHMVASW